jgi:hypothetical protein
MHDRVRAEMAGLFMIRTDRRAWLDCDRAVSAKPRTCCTGVNAMNPGLELSAASASASEMPGFFFCVFLVGEEAPPFRPASPPGGDGCEGPFFRPAAPADLGFGLADVERGDGLPWTEGGEPHLAMDDGGLLRLAAACASAGRRLANIFLARALCLRSART